MPVPYLMTTLLYFFVALLAAMDAALVSLGYAGPFAALRWVRVHFITLGVITQVVFGLLPMLSAALAQRPRPALRWDIWLALNGGLVILAAGFAGANQALIFIGGTAVFAAAALLFVQLWGIRAGAAPASLKFYLTGVGYLLLGIIIGTGLWLNWSEALYIQVPLEAHIHANSWGFLSLVFAGLLIDFLPSITGRPFVSRRDTTLIYWGMTLGAFGLVLGPWLGGSLPPTVVGIILHLGATIWMMIRMGQAFSSSSKLSSPGAWHLLSSYLWILAPVLIAPLILLGFLDGRPIEATAPQALIYGWALQFGIALFPYLARKYFLKAADPPLGGGWFSLAAATLGSLLVWLSIFILPWRGGLYGVGFALYAAALFQPMVELVQIARAGVNRLDQLEESQA